MTHSQMGLPIGGSTGTCAKHKYKPRKVPMYFAVYAQYLLIRYKYAGFITANHVLRR